MPCGRSIIASPASSAKCLPASAQRRHHRGRNSRRARSRANFSAAKGLERAVLITDATAAAGMPDGTYQLGPIQVEVKDGRCTMDGKLAGSVLTMDRAVRNVTNSPAGACKTPSVPQR
jgi:hypothetical protein